MLFYVLDEAKDLPSHEFVSDYLQASSQDIVEVQEGMKKLSLGSKRQGKVCSINIYVLLYFCMNVFTSSYKNGLQFSFLDMKK